MMPNINEMKSSKYLAKADVDPPIVATMDYVEKVDVSLDSEPEEQKWVLHFRENLLPLVLNWTNINLIAQAVGEDDTENWKGKAIVLFNDKSIMFRGKVTGGIRVRAVKTAGPTAQKGPHADFENDPDLQDFPEEP